MDKERPFLLDELVASVDTSALDSSAVRMSYSYEAHLCALQIAENSGNKKLLAQARRGFHEKFPVPSDLASKWIHDEMGETDPDYSFINSFTRDYLSIPVLVVLIECVYQREPEKLADVFAKICYPANEHPVEGHLLWLRYYELTRDANVLLPALKLPLFGLQRVADILNAMAPQESLIMAEAIKSYEEELASRMASQQFYNEYAAAFPQIRSIILARKDHAFIHDPSYKCPSIHSLAACASVDQTKVSFEDARRRARYCPHSISVWMPVLALSEKGIASCGKVWTDEDDSNYEGQQACFKGILNRADLSNRAVLADLLMFWMGLVVRHCNRRLAGFGKLAAKDRAYEDVLEHTQMQLATCIKLAHAYRVDDFELYIAAVHFMCSRHIVGERGALALLLARYSEKQALIYDRHIDILFLSSTEEKSGREASLEHLKEYASKDQRLYERHVYVQRIFGTHFTDLYSVQPQAETTPSPVSLQSIAGHGKRVRGEPASTIDNNSDNTVFVSNLDYRLQLSQLRRFFAEENGLRPVNIRMLRHPDGRFKGHAYARFDSGGADTDKELVVKALALDKQRLDGRPVFISPFNPDADTRSRPSAAEHSSGRNPKVLYASNLPVTCTENGLRRLFARHSGLCDIRMVYRKSGRFRGCAYIEYISEANAARALKEDGSMIDGHAIKVAISDPSLAPPKKEMVSKPARQLALAPATDRHAREDRLGESDTPPPPPLSNDDFRARLGLTGNAPKLQP